MNKKNNQNDSFDKRDDDDMEELANEGELEKDFSPDVLEAALGEGESDEMEDEFEHDSLDKEVEAEDVVFNNEEDSPLWKL